MHEIMELKENLMSELGEYSRNPKLSVDDVMVVKALSSAVDHLCNIIMAAEEEEGYSMRGGQGGGGNRYSYEGGQGGSRYAREGRGGNRYSRESGENRYSREGNSYARGRRGNVRRDSMGRYAREDGYSRADGMEELMDEINGMMGELPPNLQQEAQKFIQKLEQEM